MNIDSGKTGASPTRRSWHDSRDVQSRFGSADETRQNDLTIREVCPADLDALACFFMDNNGPDTTRQFHPFPLDHETARRIANATGEDRHYVATKQGSIVGFCMLRGWDEGFDVPSFGVLADHRLRGRGLGKRMTEFAISETRRLGCRNLRLTVYLSNSAAVGLYEGLGFVETSREPVVVAGEPDVRLTMAKDLADV